MVWKARWRPHGRQGLLRAHRPDVVAGYDPESVSSGEARRSCSRPFSRAVHQVQPRQSDVRSAARRRASVFVDPLRCLDSCNYEGRNATKPSCTRPPHRSWGACCSQTVSSCLNAQTAEQRVEWLAALESPSVTRPSIGRYTSAVGRGCHRSLLCGIADAGSPAQRKDASFALIECDTLTSACLIRTNPFVGQREELASADPLGSPLPLEACGRL